MMTTRRKFGLGGIAAIIAAQRAPAALVRSLVAGRQTGALIKGVGLDISDMTQLEITATADYLTYGIRKGVLASGSDSVRIYWDATGNVNDYTDYVGGFTDASHTYATAGDYVVAITDDISSLSVTGGSSTASYISNSRMLRKVTTGLKVTTMPSPGGGADEAMQFDTGNYHVIEYINLRNVTSNIRPAWSVKTYGGTLIANNITRILSYGLANAYQWNIYCDSINSIDDTSTGMTPVVGMSFWFQTKTCSQILALPNVVRTNLRSREMIKFYGTDGYVHWDTDAGAWVAVIS